MNNKMELTAYLYRRQEGVSDLKRQFEHGNIAIRVLHDPYPVRWRNEKDALADMKEQRDGTLPVVMMKNLEGDSFPVSHFIRSIDKWLEEDGKPLVNPEYKDAPIELMVTVQMGERE